MSSSTTSASAAASTSKAAASFTAGSNLKIVGIILAITSGLLIGSSFVFKKKGLLRAQAGHAAGEGVAYLKSPLWWLGMTMMILGELCNFAAYAFVEAIVVTPLGALSVVVCAILSSIFLNEKLTFFGWLGCTLCLLGSVIIALNGPTEASVGQIVEFQALFLSVGFLVYAGILIAAALGIIFFAAPRWGKKSMLWYIFVCSMIGGISVSVTTGLGAAIVTTAGGDNQFTHWFIYFLFGFVAVTLITEVYYLNVALALFNTVTPTYYVIFTFFSILTTIVLFKGLSASVSSIITLVMGFLVICVGITILQMSKVDPTELSKRLDRRSTILLQAARSQTESMEEKGALGVEDPGIDALRGSFGTVGSIIRARSARRLSQASMAGRPPGAGAPYDRTRPNSTNPRTGAGLQRHQLYDAPMPGTGIDLENRSQRSDSNATAGERPGVAKRTTIKFDSQDVVHQYHPTGPGTPRRDDAAIHMHRPALESPGLPPSGLPSPEDGYPPRTRADTEPLGGVAGVGAGGNVRTGSRDLLLGDLDDAPPIPLNSASVRQQTLSLPDAFASEHASGTLLSFPSVTDSARSANWEDEAPPATERGRGTKRYPKTGGDDDREESVSLWQRGRESPDDGPASAADSTDSSSVGGIRLVQPRF
ncbi:magnesium transporter NIPA-domain-containing protein [Mycena latifolia]|nr:magnesium transporter NIPA-domain-containing protein [Mycena latifolia]